MRVTPKKHIVYEGLKSFALQRRANLCHLELTWETCFHDQRTEFYQIVYNDTRREIKDNMHLLSKGGQLTKIRLILWL